MIRNRKHQKNCLTLDLTERKPKHNIFKHLQVYEI